MIICSLVLVASGLLTGAVRSNSTCDHDSAPMRQSAPVVLVREKLLAVLTATHGFMPMVKIAWVAVVTTSIVAAVGILVLIIFAPWLSWNRFPLKKKHLQNNIVFEPSATPSNNRIQTVDDLRSRIHFLIIAFHNSIVCLMASILLYFVSPIWNVKLICVTTACDAMSLLINAVVEYTKGYTSQEHYLFAMDMLGGGISLASLGLAAALGLEVAGEKAVLQQQAPGRNTAISIPSMANFTGLVDCPTILNMLCFGMAALTLVYGWQCRFAIHSEDRHRLNIYSGLTHVVVSLFNNCGMATVISWLVVSSMQDGPKNQAYAGVARAAFPCVIVVSFATLLAREALAMLAKMHDKCGDSNRGTWWENANNSQ